MKTIINVDIQPEYEKWITFDMHKWVNYINKISSSNHIVFLYNGKDTIGMIDEMSYKIWLVELGFNEDVIINATFYDKGYNFFRPLMDKYIDEKQISRLVKFMMKNNIYDSRDIDEAKWKKYYNSEIRYLLVHDPIFIPDLMDFIKKYKRITLLGGGKNECLKEVEIALTSLNIKYNLLTQFIY